MTPPRVLLVGIDSADPELLARALPQLPNLRRLVEGGSLRDLQSPAAVMSAAVWPTFYTGQDPGWHGYYFPMQWDAEHMRLRRVSDRWLYCEPFWYALAREGLPVTAFDVQTEFPSRIPRGVEITNWGSQSFTGMRSSDPALGRALRRRFGRHPLGPDVPAPKTRRRLAAIRRDCLAGARAKGEASLWLLRETDWRLFLTVFVELHRAGHNLWPDPEVGVPDDTALREVFRAVDREVGRLVGAVDLRETTVIVFSLHGMGSNDAQDHFLPEILDRFNARFAGRALPAARASRPQHSAMRWLRARVPGTAQEAIGRKMPDRVRDFVVSRQFGRGFDWARTPGFALPSGGEGYVRCNLAGREREGCLPADGACLGLYLKELVETLRALRIGESDAPLVADVCFPSREFAGPAASRLPDVAVRWSGEPPAREVVSPTLGRFRGRLATGRGGNHRPGGFAIVAGRRPEGIDLELRDAKDFARVVPRLLGGRAV